MLDSCGVCQYEYFALVQRAPFPWNEGLSLCSSSSSTLSTLSQWV